MPHKTLPLYKLDGYQIEMWPGYGPVAPNLWTTNGSAGYVAGLTASYFARGSVVTDSILPESVDFSNPESLATALIHAYRNWQAAKFESNNHATTEREHA